MECPKFEFSEPKSEESIRHLIRLKRFMQLGEAMLLTGELLTDLTCELLEDAHLFELVGVPVSE